MKKKVFLGGTCGKSTWRNELIPLLEIDYFNPVVEDWTPDCQKEEIRQREEVCDFVLYTITKDMEGVYSIAEVVQDSNVRPEKTLFCIIPDRFTEKQMKSLLMVDSMVQKNGAKTFLDLKSVAKYLNKEK